MKPLFANRRNSIFKNPYTSNNVVEWVQSGENYFKKLEELIDSARSEVHLQTYIFAPDETGMRIVEALIRAAQRKVEVFVVVDAYGSNDFSDELIKRFAKEGIHFRKYGRLYSGGRFHLGRRQHHKITVIDSRISIVGGINISNQYNNYKGKLPWLDFAVIMKGKISPRLRYVCRKPWAGIRYSFRSAREFLKSSEKEISESGNAEIRVRKNDFTRNKIDITISYRQAIRKAEKSILIVGGYFLPGGRTRRLLRNAIKRGVTIDVVVSERSDVKVVVYARRYLYDWLLRNGINVYEYTPSNVHGKVLITDNRWTSIGSYDLNNLSTYSNIELNVDIRDESFSSGLSAHIRSIMGSYCRKINKENPYRNQTIPARFLMWLSYRFVKTMFVLSVLLAGTEESEK